MEVMDSLDKRVQSVIQGMKSDGNIKKTIQKNLPGENIGVQLLEQFNEESEEEGSTEIPAQQTTQGGQAKNWGPIVAPRMSTRIRRDGRTAIQKAEDLKKRKDLEIPKGNINCNSFSTFNDEELLSKARKVGLKLRDDGETISHNIQAIRLIENDRLSSFKESHPECFLPVNLDISFEGNNKEHSPNVGPSCAHSSDIAGDIPTWAEVVSGKKSSCRKLEFNHGSRTDLEC